MNSLLIEFQKLLNHFGFTLTVIIVLTMIITSLIKKPIVSAATKYAVKLGVDKSVGTKYVSLIPPTVAIILLTGYELIVINFNFAALNISYILTTGSACGIAAIALYEAFKVWIKAAASKEIAAQNKTVQTNVQNPIDQSPDSQSQDKDKVAKTEQSTTI